MLKWVMAAAVLMMGCGDDGDGQCAPQGTVIIGAAGTVGAPLDNFADCYAGSMPVISLDQARSATIAGDTITFVDPGISGTIDADTCRISIVYEFDSMLSDDTPTMGTARFSADPDPGDALRWDRESIGQVDFEWLNAMNSTTVCGNQLTGIAIAIQP
jgi:hypothetical protein